jgi:hypothetical protein
VPPAAAQAAQAASQNLATAMDGVVTEIVEVDLF